jgi:hypothetical protein
MGSLEQCIAPVATWGGGRLGAVAGHPSAIAASQVTTQDVLDVIAAARSDHELVVVDLEERSTTAAAITTLADVVVGVVHASPVGVVRALEWAVDANGRNRAVPLHLAVNHAPRSRVRQEEIRAEILRTIRPTSIAWCPHDRAVEVAAWDGTTAGRGAFRSACTRIGALVDPESCGRRRWAR